MLAAMGDLLTSCLGQVNSWAVVEEQVLAPDPVLVLGEVPTRNE